MNNIIQEVTNDIDAFNVAPTILQKIPSFVKRAVINLQRKKVFPPRTIEWIAINAKETKVNNKGEVEYNFIFLPKNFRTLEELYVDDEKQPYQNNRFENYFKFDDKIETSRLYSIKEINFEEDEVPRKVLILHPFPSNDTLIRLTYHVDGTEDSLKYYADGDYLEAIIGEVRQLLNLEDPRISEDKVLDAAYSRKNRQGVNSVNGALPRTKGSFFGNTRLPRRGQINHR